MRLSRPLFALLAILIAAPFLQSQSNPSGEIKIASQPYFLDDPSAIHVKSTVVDVNVVVRDSKGKPVTGLKKEDFEIYDQGKQQKISSFNVELAHPPPMPAPEKMAGLPPAPPPPLPPRYLGMYFDDQNISQADLVFARKAAEGFIRTNMADTDRVGVFTSSTTTTLQFTSDKTQILATLAKVISHQRTAMSGATSCPKITPDQAARIMEHFDTHTDMFDMALAEAVQCNCPSNKDVSCTVEQSRLIQAQAAMVLSLAEQFAQDSLGVLGDVIRYMGKMQGQRMLIMTSGGFYSKPDAVQHAQDKLIDAALKAGIVINTLDAKALSADWAGGDPSNGPSNILTRSGGNGAMNALHAGLFSDEREYSNDSMTVLAAATGGKFIHNKNDLAGGLVEIAALPEVSYAIGFSPEDLRENGSYHILKVKIPGQRVSIAARPGYFAQSKKKDSPSAKYQKLNKEVMATDILTGVSTEITTSSTTLGTGESAIKVTAHVNGRSLSFDKENKIHSERLIFITTLFDSQGHYLAGVEAVMDMKLHDDSFDEIFKKGVDGLFTLQAPPGTYRLREVIQEVMGGRLAAYNQTVEIH
jgi:VWFA-related protein